jgi:hypothetical protein
MSNASSAAQRETSDLGSELLRSACAIALLLGLFAFLAFAPRRDPAQTIAGLPCSVVSENTAGQILGTPVRLLPTTGTICRYVSAKDSERSLYVVARHDDDPSLGNATHRIGDSLYVRRGRHTFVFTVVGAGQDEATRLAIERSLAGAVARTVVARNR